MSTYCKRPPQLSSEQPLVCTIFLHVIHYLYSMPHFTDLISDFSPEEPACSAWGHRPCIHIFRVWPHEITECPLVWNLLATFYGPDLIQRLDVRGQASMDAQNHLINDLRNTRRRINVLIGRSSGSTSKTLTVHIINFTILSFQSQFITQLLSFFT